MHCRSALLLASILGTAAAQAPTNLPHITGSVTVVLHADEPTPPIVLKVAEREAESLLAPAGLRVLWATDAGAPGVYERVAIISLRGACRSDARLPTSVPIGRVALGQTQVADGDVLPFADVLCNPIRGTIAHELQTRQLKKREEILGRVIGRVMTHELYHILLRSTSHGREGLARAAQSSEDLVSDRGSFAQADERKLSESAENEER